MSGEKLFNKNTGNVTFFLATIDFCICPNTREFFLFFFLIFENPVYRKMFDSYLWIVSIDYPETSWV